MNNLAGYLECVPTPYGDGTVVKRDNEASLVFRGPYAKEALEWALTEGIDPANRERMLTILRMSGG